MSVRLIGDRIEFRFPDVDPGAVLTIDLHRTLRIPDDARSYSLPPSLGRFPVRDVDALDPARTPDVWRRRGGAVLPMWQAEALWIGFHATWPFAVKVGAGKINAVDGNPWVDPLQHDEQDFVVVPKQPWLDGWVVEKGRIRQFVAAPLGSGATVEEQLTGAAEFGGLQFRVVPLSTEATARWQRRRQGLYHRRTALLNEAFEDVAMSPAAHADMGLGAGGSMEQQIYESPFDRGDWLETAGQRLFVSIANSLAWRNVTGEAPPTVPPTAADYARAGLPWFEHYEDAPVVGGGAPLHRVKSLGQLDASKPPGDKLLPENEGFETDPDRIVQTGPVEKRRQGLRESDW